MDEQERMREANLEFVDDEPITTIGEAVVELREIAEDLEQEIGEECPILFDSEVDWLLGILPDKWLTKLLGRIQYGTDNMEYYYDKEKCLSCGAMNYIKASIVKVIAHRQKEGKVVEW